MARFPPVLLASSCLYLEALLWGLYLSAFDQGVSWREAWGEALKAAQGPGSPQWSRGSPELKLIKGFPGSHGSFGWLGATMPRGRSSTAVEKLPWSPPQTEGAPPEGGGGRRRRRRPPLPPGLPAAAGVTCSGEQPSSRRNRTRGVALLAAALASRFQGQKRRSRCGAEFDN